MNKADYIALINDKLESGSEIPASDHRETMHTDPNSIIEIVYGEKTTDSNALQLKTVKNNDFNYTIEISKVGRYIKIDGQITAITNGAFTIFTVSDADFQGTGRCTATNTSNGSAIVLVMKPTGFQTNNMILAGQVISFSITYNAEN